MADETPGQSLLKKCTARQQAFVLALLADPEHNQAAAYRKAGYQTKGDGARNNAGRLMSNDHVRQAYETLLAEAAAKVLPEIELTAKDVLFAIARHVRADGYADVRELFDKKGNLKNIQGLSDNAAMRIGGLEVVKRNLTTGDGEVDTIIKVKLRDHSRYVEMAAKHFALLANVKVNDSEDWGKWAARLAEARAKK